MEKNNNILVETLNTGRNRAKILQNFLCGEENDNGSVSIDDLVMEILESFTYGLSLLNSSCGSWEIFGSAFCSGASPSDVFTGECEKIPPPLVKERRGCYKRRSMDSRDEVTYAREDGHQWRKYGQKKILNSKFPRCYFRCTYKDDHGCTALKQVQQLEGESNKFHIKYFGRHTCPTSPQDIVSHHPPAETRVLLDFERFKNNGYLANNPFTTKNTHINPSKKQKIQSNKVKPRNDAQSAPTLVSNDSLLDGFYPFSESPGYDNGDSSMKIVSNGPLNDIFVDDILLITGSLWD